MNHNTHVNYTTLQHFLITLNHLPLQLLIQQPLTNATKPKLKLLIHQPLINKNHNHFIQYTNQFKQFHPFLTQ
ncbi:IDEAL domain protein [Staphylococcus epidermidis]|uniref:IDEAL domain protein n=1 Tax=Staphylococcus epidermidis TaxID=1282 RepID=UPI0011AA8F1A|nr:IDEAL domain protein [Staphylococcus epidermidis]